MEYVPETSPASVIDAASALLQLIEPPAKKQCVPSTVGDTQLALEQPPPAAPPVQRNAFLVNLSRDRPGYAFGVKLPCPFTDVPAEPSALLRPPNMLLPCPFAEPHPHWPQKRWRSAEATQRAPVHIYIPARMPPPPPRPVNAIPPPPRFLPRLPYGCVYTVYGAAQRPVRYL